MDNKTRVVMLGTGTPNANPDRSGPAVAIIHRNKSYLVDVGPGVVRQASKAFMTHGIEALKPKNLSVAFLTHLHSDHTVGLPDLILSPWVLGRKEPLKLFGPKGTDDMSYHLERAYASDIQGRLNGFEPANPLGYKVESKEVEEGLVYSNTGIEVFAFKVNHPPFESYGYKFVTEDKIIVVSGDSSPSTKLMSAAQDCDILIHEVYSHDGLSCRDELWQKYHKSVHTSSLELGTIALKCNVKKLVLYHHLFMLNLQDIEEDLEKSFLKREIEMVNDIRKSYKGTIISSNDMDIIE